MWRKNSIAVFLLLCCLALHAAPSGFQPTPNLVNKPQINTGLKLTTPIARKPVITGYKLPRPCVSPGEMLSILGRNFGAQKKAVLGGNGLQLELKVDHWNDARIDAYVPRDGRLLPGKRYYTGIKYSRSGAWLSNTNKSFVICQGAVRALSKNIGPSSGVSVLQTAPTRPSVPSPVFDNRRRSGQGEPGGSATDSTDPASQSAYEDYYGEDYDDSEDAGWDDIGYGPEPDTPRVLPNAGGSLIDAELPPPPPNLQLQQQSRQAARDNSVPGELLVVSNDMDQARELAQQLGGYGLSPKRRKLLKSLGLVITVFRVPADVELQDIATEVRQSYPKMWVDMNTRYQLLGGDTRRAMQQIQWPRNATTCGRNLRIGMIDTAVNTRHPALAQANITTHEVMSRGIQAAGPAHGTAVASLLVGGSDTLNGLLPAARLYAVNVFQQRGKQVDTTAEWVISAVDWLLTQKVNAINMSLGGPRNLLIDVALQRTIQSGVVVVAAAGNSGPGAAPVYPAAQPGVIAVTAVDSHNAIYRKASQGKYIDFAAPGVDIWAAAGGAGGKYVSGSSYAAPFVTAAMAVVSARQGVKQAYQKLQKQARDLGPTGKDPVYGWGLIQVAGSCQ